MWARRGLHVTGEANPEEPIEVVTGAHNKRTDAPVFLLADIHKYWRGYRIEKIPLQPQRSYTQEGANTLTKVYEIYDPGLYEVKSTYLYRPPTSHFVLLHVDEMRGCEVLCSTLLEGKSYPEFKQVCYEHLLKENNPKWVRKDRYVNVWKRNRKQSSKS